MSDQFEHLFTPIRIGPVEIPNRICFSAHSCNLAESGLPTDRETAYYAERAKGGAGWIVIGGTQQNSDDLLAAQHNDVSDERAIPLYRKLTDAVHAVGAKISTQVDNYGRAGWYPRIGHAPLLAPSSLAEVGLEQPKEMDEDDMDMVVEDTRRGIRVAKKSGFDGIEFLSSMGSSVLQGFLSPLTNQREDEYGGSLENRLRFPLRLIGEARDELGRDHCLGIKLSGDEFFEGGLTQEELKAIAVEFEKTGCVDYIHACAGAGGSSNSILVSIPEMSYPAGFAAYLAAGIREVVSIPVVAVKRINDPLLAEQLLATGQADIIGMTRALITDPELPNKAREGRLDEIRQCTGSNQECIQRTLKGLAISCIHNPAVGEEATLGIGTLAKATAPKKVAVIGGGVAGMKAAEVAAARGHEVSLFERQDELGGQVRWMASINSRKDYESITRFLSTRIKRLGVEVQLNQEICSGDIDTGYDAVVVATGALPLKTGYTASNAQKTMPGANQENVFTVFDVFNGDIARIGERVLVIDDLGEPEAMMVAEHLADQGRKVEIVTQLNYVGMQVDHFAWASYAERLAERGAKMTALTGITHIDGNTVHGANYDGEYRRQVDSVLLVMGKKANNTLYRELKGRVSELHQIGDCVIPRRVTDAIWEGNKVGRAL